jgi:hypothetical protein
MPDSIFGKDKSCKAIQNITMLDCYIASKLAAVSIRQRQVE